MPENEIEELLKIRDVAKKLKCSINSVRNMVRDGRLAAYQPTKTWLIPLSEVKRLLESTKIPT